MATTTIAGIASGSPDFELLTAAAEAFGLDDALADPSSDLTVFAPTDAAFVRLAQDLGYADSDEAGALDYLVANVDAATLLAVLQYHVLPGAQDAATLTGLGTFTTLAGPTITLSGPVLEDQEPDRIDPVLIQTDIEATNGIVHVIDNVLLPADLPGITAPTIAGIVAASGAGPDADPTDFDMLLAAVGAAGLTAALDAPAADLTVFAPTDGAFLKLAGDLGYGGTDEAGALSYLLTALGALNGGDAVGLLTSVLLYHVSDGAKQLAEVALLPEVDTLLGATIGVDAANGVLIDAEPDLADPALVATDIQASNGIVHVIDGVLLPADLPAELPDDGGRFLFADPDGGILRGGRDGDVLVGSAADDRVFGFGGGQTVYAGEGDDFVRAGRGDDEVWGGNGDDRIRLGLGDDVAAGGDGDDRIFAGRGDDVIGGGAGDDVLRGFSGDDILEGGAGNDHMNGGVGADTFLFEDGFGHDVIQGFRVREGDMLDFSAHDGVAEIGDLAIEQRAGFTLVSDGDGNEIALLGVRASTLGEDAFLF